MQKVEMRKLSWEVTERGETNIKAVTIMSENVSLELCHFNYEEILQDPKVYMIYDIWYIKCNLNKYIITITSCICSNKEQSICLVSEGERVIKAIFYL